MKLSLVTINEIVITNKNNPRKFRVFQQYVVNENIYKLLQEIQEHKKVMKDIKTKYNLFPFC